MKKIVLLLLFFLPLSLPAQTNNSLSKHYVSLSGGFSKHGTGDMRGFSQNISFASYFKKKLAWTAGIGSTLHDGEYRVTSTVDGEFHDHSFRYTAGALQLIGGISFSAVRIKSSEFGVRANGLVRYQSSSYFDQLEIIFDPNNPNGIPYPATYIFNLTPQRTLSLGVSPEIFYNQTIGKTIFLGISANFQADTNGDVLTNVSLSLGKRFR